MSISYAVFCLKKKSIIGDRPVGAGTPLRLRPPGDTAAQSSRQAPGLYRALHSFPTRRSSDLWRNLMSPKKSNSNGGTIIDIPLMSDSSVPTTDLAKIEADPNV